MDKFVALLSRRVNVNADSQVSDSKQVDAKGHPVRHVVQVARAIMAVIPDSWEHKKDFCLELGVVIRPSAYMNTGNGQQFKMLGAILSHYMRDVPEHCEWKKLLGDIFYARVDHRSYVPREPYVSPFFSARAEKDDGSRYKHFLDIVKVRTMFL